MNFCKDHCQILEEITPGKYQHYKTGKLYEVLGTALHSETREEMIVYQALYRCEQFGDKQIWVRPKKLFIEYVDYNGYRVPRFKRIDK